jgi:flagellar biogenesis protein FliO
MNRVWIARAIGILILLAFILLMIHLQRRLMELQQGRQGTTTSTSR